MKKNILLKLSTAIFLAFCLAVPFFGLSLPKPEGWVSDLAGVMDEGSKQKVTAIITDLEQKTSCEIAVVTVKDLGGDTIENAAVTLFKEWGIGKKGKDNGILILVSVNDRKVKIEVGYGLEGILPDGLCGQILRTYILPEFKNSNYSGGITKGAYAVALTIAKDRGVELTGAAVNMDPPPQQNKPNTVRTIFNVIFFLVLLIIFIRHPFLFLLFLGGGGRGSGGSSGGFGGGGFGGFGGGMSGGGGASGSW